MPTTLDLTRLSRTSLRMLVASCAADPRVDVPAAQRKALWTALGDQTWAPTADDSPVPLTTVQTWLQSTQGTLRAWLETHLHEQLPPHHPESEPCTCQPGTAGWARHHGSAAGTLPEAFHTAIESCADTEEEA